MGAHSRIHLSFKLRIYLRVKNHVLCIPESEAHVVWVGRVAAVLIPPVLPMHLFISNY